MFRKKALLILVLTILFIFPLKVCATNNEYTLTMSTSHKEKYDDNGKKRNLVSVDSFIYYSFIDNGDLKIIRDGDTCKVNVPAYFYAKEGSENLGAINMPAYTLTGTIDESSDKTTIELCSTETINITSHIGDEYDLNKNYVFHVSNIKINMSYNNNKIKGGAVEATCESTYDVSSENDANEVAVEGKELKNFYIKSITISGLDDKKTVTNVASSKENTNKKDVLKTEDNNKSENGSKVPIVVAVIGGVAVLGFAATKLKKPKSITNQGKTFNYDETTDEYVSEDGKTILDVDRIEEVRKQEESNRKFADEQFEKLKNRETFEDIKNKEMAKQNEINNKQLEKELYAEKVANEHGINSDDFSEIRKELENKQEVAVKNAEDRMKIADHLDVAVKTAETIEEGADIAIAIGEATIPGGKAVSAGYKVLKSTASSVAENGLDAAKTTSAIIKGSIDAATTFVDSGIVKATATVGGEVAGDTVEATIQGKNVEEVLEAGVKAAAKGSVKAVVNATGDAIGKGTNEAIGNVVANEYQKHVVDPKMEEKLKKNKK